jgi:beta propeller repeat protein
MKSMAIKCLVAVRFSIAFCVPQLPAETGEEFAVYPSFNDQLSPDIDGSIIVWQEFVEGVIEGDGGPVTVQDWDVYGLDLSGTLGADLLYISTYLDDQITPVISGNLVAFSSYVDTDFNIWAADITEIDDEGNGVDYIAVSEQPYVDEQNPAIHGNTVVWQDDRYQQEGSVSDLDVFGADIHNIDSIVDFLVTPYGHDDQIGYDQQKPAIWRNRVVSETNYFGDYDIMSSDVWLKDNPDESAVLYDEGQQTNPAISGDIVVWQDDAFGDSDIFAADISNPDSPEIFEVAFVGGQQVNPDIDGNIVVWQDNYAGNWDIYGYNITTGREFVICDNGYDQKNPAISGNIVVWEDDRDGLWQIYAIILDESEIADCDVNPEGDLNGDCKVDLSDLAIFSANWLRDELTW